MKTLVTGATGFIGSEIVRQLVAAGQDVRILYRPTARLDLLGDLAAQVEHRTGDVTDIDSVRAAMGGVEQVFHTAGFIGFGGRQERARLQQINVGGTANVVNAALEASVLRLVHTSSMAALGRSEKAAGTIDERTEWQPSKANSAYAVSKYQGELEVYRAVEEGLDAVVVNPALVFGAGRPGENTWIIADKIRRGKLPGIPVGGTNVVDVRDVATGHLLAMEKGVQGERYFLGSQNLSWEEIIRTFADAFGVEPPRRRVPPIPALIVASILEGTSRLTGRPPILSRETVRNASQFYRYDNRKAREELEIRFRSFSDTARYMADTML